jgi:hypothetical protein
MRPKRRVHCATAPLYLVVAILAPSWASAELSSGETSIRFDLDILSDLGIGIVAVEQSALAIRSGGLGFRVENSSQIAFDAPGGDFEGFESLALHHAGGFAFTVSGQTLPFDGVPLTTAAPPYEFALRDATGARRLLTRSMHASLSPNGSSLHIANADLLIAPELAALLGRPDLAGSYVGVLDAEFSFEEPVAAAQGAATQQLACVADFGPPPDVELIGLSSLTQAVRAGGRVAMAPSADLRNNGPGDVRWSKAIAPDTPVGVHPFLALHFYRLAGGVLEQIGRSDLKHAFNAVNSNCACPSGSVLYVGCEDTYGVNTNLNRHHLAPREEVNTLTRAWVSLGSHFDATPVDDFRDHEAIDHDDFEHRLTVSESDLQTAGADYFIEAWYLAERDTNLLNSLGHRAVVPTFGGSTWSFPTAASLAPGSVLDEFVDAGNPPAGAASVLVDTGEGRVQLAVATSDLGGGVFHYEYALMNFDVERQIRSFTVNRIANQTVSNAGFGDTDDAAGNDWMVAIDSASITWTAPPGNALDWGTLYNFRFDVDGAPVVSTAQIEPLDPGSPGAFPLTTLAPAAANVPALPVAWLMLLFGLFLLVGWWAAAHRPSAWRDARGC